MRRVAEGYASCRRRLCVVSPKAMRRVAEGEEAKKVREFTFGDAKRISRFLTRLSS
jgi:hypothetical protein